MRVIFYLCLSLLFTACATETITEVRTRYIVVQPPVQYTADIKVIPPPDPEKYSQMQYLDKEEALVNWSDSLLQAIGEANRRLAAIRESVNSAVRTYESKE